MRALRIPLRVWTWRSAALLLLVVVAPLLGTLSHTPDGDALSTLSDARSLIVGAGALAAGVFLHLQWRLTGNPTSGWLAILLAAAAVPEIALGAFTLAHPDRAEAQASWVFVSRVAILVVVLCCLLLSRTRRLHGDPLAVGLVTGTALAGLRHLVLVEAPALPSPPAFAVVRVAVLTVLAGAVALAAFRLAGFPSRARVRVASGLLLVGLGSAVGGLVGLGTGIVGTVLLAAAAAAALDHAIEEEKLEVEELRQRLQAMELGLREDRARLHEINATVAGIASAQKLMTQGLSLDRTDALASMVRGEVERLQRLVSDRGPSRRRTVDLDDTIGRIVLSHLARGRIVVWEPSGLRVTGRADEIAEVLNILLENAAVHGGPDAVSVSVAPSQDGPGVTITVSDQGPGISPEVRDRIFDWGVSGPASPGQGIGLHLAADIARQLGGRLELLPATAGAAFALHLEAAGAEVGAREHVA